MAPLKIYGLTIKYGLCNFYFILTSSIHIKFYMEYLVAILPLLPTANMFHSSIKKDVFVKNSLSLSTALLPENLLIMAFEANQQLQHTHIFPTNHCVQAPHVGYAYHFSPELDEKNKCAIAEKKLKMIICFV
jgi:hypothetical protein